MVFRHEYLPKSMIPPDPLHRSINWHSSSVNTTQVGTGTIWFRYAYIHTAVFQDLQPYCIYEYQVANGKLWSSLYRFSGTTPGSAALDSYQLLILGDLGTYANGQLTTNLMNGFLTKKIS